ncbi:alpha/beta fold hydrolase [Bacteroides timonensis]|uniref:alpha/beta fold hydrolase n=1 Tax=Bacteroides timonensis TaxID=1470345 RepID=UPI001ADF5181|nr:alpha/beta hydrolase [Bacteroides timonensis]
MKQLITKSVFIITLCCGFCPLPIRGQNKIEKTMNYSKVNYHYCKVEDVELFYRTAGDRTKPAMLLLHGFPSSSHMFRDLIPELADDFYVIAPDYPGFGQTEAPGRDKFDYTFEHLTDIVDAFTQNLKLKRFALYVFDYGAPIGFRLAMRHPEQITAIISQNGNVYREGLGKKWAAREAYWRNPTPELRKEFSSAFAPETIKGQYLGGTADGAVSPDGYTLDIAYVSQPGRSEIQSDLILDYRTNVALYPVFQTYLREYQPPLLAVWGKNDPSFIPQGAEAFKRDVPNAEIHWVDSGHFALETHAKEIGQMIVAFMKKLP